MRGVVRSSGTFSGGTFHSALNAMSRLRQAKAAAAARSRAEPRPEGRSSRAVAGKPQRDPVLGLLAAAAADDRPGRVARSGAALPSYGPKFRYSHFAGTKTLRYAAGGAVGVAAIGCGRPGPPAAQPAAEPRPPGEGPDERRRARSWFTVDFVGEAGGTTVHTKVSGGDPGYDETAKMLAESALCLAFDDNPVTAGQVTTAQAMGQNLLTRLRNAGIALRGHGLTRRPMAGAVRQRWPRRRSPSSTAARYAANSRGYMGTGPSRSVSATAKTMRNGIGQRIDPARSTLVMSTVCWSRSCWVRTSAIVRSARGNVHRSFHTQIWVRRWRFRSALGPAAARLRGKEIHRAFWHVSAQ